MLLATCYVAGIATLYGALGTVVGLAGKQTGEHLADPRVIIPLVDPVRGHGRLDVRRVRAESASVAAGAPVACGRQRSRLERS